MKQTCLINAKENEKGIAGQARKDSSFRMNKINLTVIIFLIFCCACTQKEEKQQDILKIKIDVTTKAVPMDISNDVESEFDIIRLETNDDNLIARIDEICYENNSFYILDKTSHAIFRFSDTGKYLSKLDKQGQGPDEYISINEFMVIDENLWIYDNEYSRILCYDTNNTVVDRIDLKHKHFNVAAMSHDHDTDNIYLVDNWMGNQPINYLLWTYNIKTKKLNHHRPYAPLGNPPGYIAYRGMNRHIAKYDNNCLVAYSYCDTLFQIEEGGLIPSYQFVYSEPIEDIPVSIEKYMSNPNIKMDGLDKIYQTAQSIILQITKDSEFKFAVYNKMNHSCRVGSEFVCEDVGKIQIFPVFINKDIILAIDHDPASFKIHIQTYLMKNAFKRPSDKEKLNNIANQIQDDDNPIIIKFKIKEGGNL
jgi:hypothetical protein